MYKEAVIVGYVGKDKPWLMVGVPDALEGFYRESEEFCPFVANESYMIFWTDLPPLYEPTEVVDYAPEDGESYHYVVAIPEDVADGWIIHHGPSACVRFF